MRQTDALIQRAHQTVDLTYRRLRVPTSGADPYVAWAGPRLSVVRELSRMMTEEATARIAVSDQLVALARRLMRASRERRLGDRGRLSRDARNP